MKVLKYLFLGLVLLIGAVVAYLATLDLNDYKDDLARQAEVATGRRIAIEGDLKFAPSLIPTAVVEGVTLGNAEWGKAPHLLKVGSFEARVALLPLLSKQVHVRRLYLAETDVQLEVGKDGKGNWVLGKDEAAPAAPGESVPLSVRVDEVVLRNARLSFRDDRTGASHVLSLSEVDLKAGGFADPLEIVARLSYQEMPVAIEGRFGSLEVLTSGGKEFPVDLKVDIGLKAPLSSFNPLHVAGTVQRAVDGSTITISGLNLTAGNTAVTGEITVARGSRTAVNGRLNSPLLDLSPFASDEEKPKASKLFSAEKLPLEGLKAVDADLRVTLGELRSRDSSFQDVQLPLKLAAGRLSVKPFKARHAGGSVSADVNLDAAAAKPRLDLNLAFTQFELGKLPAVQRKKTLEGGPADLTIKAAGSGDSVAAIMGALNGQFLLKVGPGRIASNVASKPGVGVILKTFDSLNPLAKSEPYSQLECAVVNLQIKDGIATTDKGIALQTSKITMVGSGAVNLKTEQLDLGFRPYAREGTGVNLGTLAGAGRVGGTLADPKLVIDAANVLKAGATAGAAVMTFGLSTLAQGMFDKTTADPRPCDTALGKAPPKPAATPASEPGQQSAEKTKESAPNPIKGTTDAVKGALDKLFGK
jgi:uncharacterized protein involved in outer membrane biogenesis